jgi:RNA polymerase sigma factor (sigma-70 family)
VPHSARVTDRAQDDVASQLEPHRRLVWNVAYRITGVAADADDVVQDTFARALVHVPRTDRPLRPWLVTVAANRAKDLLRARRRRSYVGPWLPSPVPDEALDVDDGQLSPEQRLALKQSAGAAFMVALEQLTPQRRAVLILRDVLECSAQETAAALSMSEDAVKQALHRARRSLQRAEVRTVDDAHVQRTQATLEKLMVALAARDAGAVERLLAADVRALTDGGGAYFAARVPVVGRAKVANFALRLQELTPVTRLDVVMANGLPALDMGLWPKHGVAPRALLQIHVDDAGRITLITSVVAPRKLTNM